MLTRLHEVKLQSCLCQLLALGSGRGNTQEGKAMAIACSPCASASVVSAPPTQGFIETLVMDETKPKIRLQPSAGLN